VQLRSNLITGEMPIYLCLRLGANIFKSGIRAVLAGPVNIQQRCDSLKTSAQESPVVIYHGTHPQTRRVVQPSPASACTFNKRRQINTGITIRLRADSVLNLRANSVGDKLGEGSVTRSCLSHWPELPCIRSRAFGSQNESHAAARQESRSEAAAALSTLPLPLAAWLNSGRSMLYACTHE
jgi:hypothetical protein